MVAMAISVPAFGSLAPSPTNNLLSARCIIWIRRVEDMLFDHLTVRIGVLGGELRPLQSDEFLWTLLLFGRHADSHDHRNATTTRISLLFFLFFFSRCDTVAVRREDCHH